MFFAGILVFIEWLWKLFWNRVRSNFSPKVTMPYVSKWHSYKSCSSWLLHETYCTQVNLCCKEFFSTNKQLATFIDQSWQPNPQHKYWLFQTLQFEHNLFWSKKTEILQFKCFLLRMTILTPMSFILFFNKSLDIQEWESCFIRSSH